MKTIIWKNEIKKIHESLLQGKTTEEIGNFYSVSRQRIYQVMTKFGLSTNIKKRKNFLRDREPKYYWLNRMLTVKGINKGERNNLLETFEIPEFCPMLNIKLNYDGTGREGFSRDDNSPSIDRIDSNKGYTKENIHIISWRANRIKNDSTVEELIKITNYMVNLTRNTLQI